MAEGIYTIKVQCGNCDFSGEVTPPKGTPLRLLPCPNCGCTGVDGLRLPRLAPSRLPIGRPVPDISPTVLSPYPLPYWPRYHPWSPYYPYPAPYTT